jgi:hypothetical protein
LVTSIGHDIGDRTYLFYMDTRKSFQNKLDLYP